MDEEKRMFNLYSQVGGSSRKTEMWQVPKVPMKKNDDTRAGMKDSFNTFIG